MMDSNSVLALAAFAVAALGGLFLHSAIQVRRHRERLVTLGSRHGMGLIQGALSGAAIEHARRFAREKRKVKLRDILMGEDEDGRFHFARRSVAGRQHDVLFAMNSSETHVEEFHVVPSPSAAAREKRRWHERSLPIASGSDWRLDLQWSSARSCWLEGHSLGVAARVLGLLARMSDAPGAVPMGVELHSRTVLIHSDRPLKGDEIHRFVDDAIRLRRQILQTVRRVESRSADRPSRAIHSRALDEDVQVQVLR